MDGNSDWGEYRIRQAGLTDATANGIVQQCKLYYMEAKCYIDNGWINKWYKIYQTQKW